MGAGGLEGCSGGGAEHANVNVMVCVCGFVIFRSARAAQM